MSIIITGGTKGIGLAVAKRLAKSGVRMVLGYLSDETAAQFAIDTLSATGAKVATARADIATIDGCEFIVDKACRDGGAVTHVIHCAASIYPTSLLDADLPRFSRAIETNGVSLLYLVAAAVPFMTRGGSIVFITSSGARRYQPAYGALGCGKALAESIMQYLVPELAPLGIRINSVGPGLTDTSSVTSMVGSAEAAARAIERAAQRNPSRRAGRDSDFTSLVEYLLSSEAEFIQGQVIQADGGVS